MFKDRLLNTTELAELLGYTVGSLHTLRWRIKRGIIDKNRLPEPIMWPGQLRWSKKAVERWLEAFNSHHTSSSGNEEAEL